MNNLKIRMLFILLGYTVFISSCEKDVSRDITLLNSEPRLVIEGGIEKHDDLTMSQEIRLITTANFLSEDDNPPIVDAIVLVSDSNDSWFFKHQGNGLYTNDLMQPSVGMTYTISIVWESNTYEATETLVEVPKIENLRSQFKEGSAFGGEGYVAALDFEDRPDEENYYYFRVFRNGEFIISPDEGNSSNIIRSDEFFNGQRLVGVEPNTEVVFEIDDAAKIEMLSISERQYEYLRELFTRTVVSGLSFGGSPPPASIRGNIVCTTDNKKRALGYFYASDVSGDSILITE